MSEPNNFAGLIFDVGMDTCQDTGRYLKKGFRVVAVDANPSACAAANARFAGEIASGQLTVLCRAISETQAPLPFHVCTTNSMLSTANDDLRDRQLRFGHTFETIEVQGSQIAALFEEFGTPYFFKLDIEGYDLLCLHGMLGLTEKPKYLSTELDFKKLGEQISCLEALGYRRFAIVGQGSVPRQVSPRPALEGAYVDEPFAIHSSGLFGRELPAEWVSGGALRLKCLQIRFLYKLTGLIKRLEAIRPLRNWLLSVRQALPVHGQWYDVHATY